MSRAAAHPNPVEISLPMMVGLLMFAIVCASPQVLHDGDTFTHIAAGSWMIEHRSVLDFDPFTATFAGQPWNAHEWLSEVLLGLAYRGGGLTGVVLLTAGAVGLTFAGLTRHVQATSGRVGAMVLVSAALVCVMPTILARPHILALGLLEAWVAELLVARRQGRSPRWWMLPLMTLWANLHGGFAIGLALALAFALEATVQGQTGRAALGWWAFLAGATGAALLTPQGWQGLWFPFHLLQFRSLALVMEWQPFDVSRDVGFACVVLVLLAALGSRRVRLTGWRLLLLGGFAYLGFAHVRHQLLFGIVGALILAEPVGRAFPATRAGVSVGRLGRRSCLAAVAVIVMLRSSHPVLAGDSPATPVSAVSQLPAGLAGRPVLNTVWFGGYLALVGLHPFVDGRLELFGDDFVFAANAMARPGGMELQRAIERYGFAWALLGVGDPLIGRFERLAGWRREYGDAVAVVFVREAGAGSARSGVAGVGSGNGRG